jgi:hypothetical protein
MTFGSLVILTLFLWLFWDDLRGNPNTFREPTIHPVGVKRGYGQPTETDFSGPGSHQEGR